MICTEQMKKKIIIEINKSAVHV